MGLIKLALIGGTAYYAVKGITSEREKNCPYNRRSKYQQDSTRSISDEKTTTDPLNPPAYMNPTDNQSPYPNTAEKATSPAYQHPFQQMIFTEPKGSHQSPPQHSIEYTPHNSPKQNYTTLQSIPVSNPHDDAINRAMSFLHSGDTEKARQILAGAMGQK